MRTSSGTEIRKVNPGNFQLYSDIVGDPHQFYADPDPAFHLNADLDPDPNQCDGNYLEGHVLEHRYVFTNNGRL